MSWVCHFCSTSNVDEDEACFVCGKKRIMITAGSTAPAKRATAPVRLIKTAAKGLSDRARRAILRVIDARIAKQKLKLLRLERLRSKIDGR